MASTVADDERLDINKVINKECELDKYVLYASEISVDDVNSLIETLQEPFAQDALSSQTTSLIEYNESSLKSTNSNRFYNGEVAQQQISNMNKIANTLDNIKNYVSRIDLQDISSVIYKYNTALSDLKKDSRKKLLEQEADKFNAKKEEWDGYPQTVTYVCVNGVYDGPAYPDYDSKFNYCMVEDADTEEYSWGLNTDDIIEPEIVKDEYGSVITTTYTYTYIVHKYKKIKYWDYFKKIQSPFDPTFEEIEAMFIKVGLEIPYDKTKFNGDVGDKNNKWGWN